MVQSRDAVFDRVVVDHLMAGASRVSWRLRPRFQDPGPYTFQLLIGESDIAAADDWTPIGTPEVDVVQLFDTTQPRDLTFSPTTRYRVRMTTSEGVYDSPPVDCLGRLNRRDWLIARAITRRELLHSEKRAGSFGWLFKRRKRTPAVTDNLVIDYASGEVIKTANTEGVGTDRIGGYFAPVAMFMSLGEPNSYPQRDETVGMTDALVTQARAINYPAVEHNDVWATATGDLRYAVHGVNVIAQVREVGILVQATLRQLSPTDPIYDLDLPDVPAIQTAGRAEI